EGQEHLLEKPFHVYVEEQVQRTPEQTAVVYMDRQLTYRELNEQANRLACALRASGIGPESIVGILADRSVELIVAVLAVWKAGGAYVPLDPDYPSDRIQFMLADSGAAVLLTQSHLLHLTQSEESAKGGARQTVMYLDDLSIYTSETTDAPSVNEPQDLAYVIYTSGTTGRPKGVM
ncbi:AMP-binding protein, partial [Paenibacillus sp. SI8]|uniref:AMP-binding protein n=1 Tax=Paenibacillus sp. SI8 TaxID=3163026 RepID=UPI0034666B1C